MKSQTNQILEYLQTGQSITPLDALEKFNCFRLSGRILDLRQAGHNVQTEMVSSGGKHFAKYFLKVEKI